MPLANEALDAPAPLKAVAVHRLPAADGPAPAPAESSLEGSLEESSRRV
jgi:hypothetical protein